MTITVSRTGKAIARSGIQPAAAHELLSFLSVNAEALAALVRDCAESDDDARCDAFAFVMIHAVLSSSEFSAANARRFIPYQLYTAPLETVPISLRPILFPGSEDGALNGAILARRWVAGSLTRDIEAVFDVRSGVLTTLYNDVANILRGLVEICYAATSKGERSRLPAALAPSAVPHLRQLVGPIRQTAARLQHGLPEDVLWLVQVRAGGDIVLNRQNCMRVRRAGLGSPNAILDAGRMTDLIKSLGGPNPAVAVLARRLQEGVRAWRGEERKRLTARQIARAPAEMKDALSRYYAACGTAFEDALVELLGHVGVTPDARDAPGKNAFPDIVTSSLPAGVVAIECKSKPAGDAVQLNDATDVIRKAAVNGFGQSFKVTVCQPYVSPDVPRKLSACGELCVVDAEDIAEAIVRLRIGRVSLADFSDWLCRPGQATRELLPSTIVGAKTA